MLYELRTYNCSPGKLPATLNRFEHITIGIWKRHGIRPVGFWTTLIGESNQQINYMLAWESLAEREQKWTAFSTDPEWIEKRGETEKNGPLVASFSNQILQPTTFSAMK